MTLPPYTSSKEGQEPPHAPIATKQYCAEKEQQLVHTTSTLNLEPQAINERTRPTESALEETRESAMDGVAYESAEHPRLPLRTRLAGTRRDGPEAQQSRSLRATEKTSDEHFLLSRRSLLAGLAGACALGLGIPAGAGTDRLILAAGRASDRSIVQGDYDVDSLVAWQGASTKITPIWQGEPSEYQNQQEWQREHDHTCCPTSIATVLNAWYDEQSDRQGRPPQMSGQGLHIRDVLHEAMRQRAYISGAGTYWIGSVASIAARFGFRTIWGYDATSYLAYAAAVWDLAAGHDLFKVLEYLVLGKTAPLLLGRLKQQAQGLFLKETENKAARQVPLELVRYIARRGFPVLVDLWSPQWPLGHTVTVYGGLGQIVYYADPGTGLYEQAQIETFREAWVRDFAILYPRQVQFPRDLVHMLQSYPTVYAS